MILFIVIVGLLLLTMYGIWRLCRMAAKADAASEHETEWLEQLEREYYSEGFYRGQSKALEELRAAERGEL